MTMKILQTMEASISFTFERIKEWIQDFRILFVPGEVIKLTSETGGGSNVKQKSIMQRL